MATIYDLLDTVAQLCTTAINAAGITTPMQVFKGWPVAGDLTNILAQQQCAVSVYDHGHAKQGLRYIGKADHQLVPTNGGTIVATATPSTGALSFAYGSGYSSVPAGLNIHTFVGSGATLADAYYQTLATDTPATIATAVIAAINALAISGVVATSTGSGTLSVTGSPALKCNVGGFATFAKEAGRQLRTVQVSVWAPNPALRQSIAEAILENVGVADIPFITLTDGTITWFRYDSDTISDESQADYSLYEHHILFNAELPVLRRYTTYEVVGYVAQQTPPATGITEVGG